MLLSCKNGSIFAKVQFFSKSVAKKSEKPWARFDGEARTLSEERAQRKLAYYVEPRNGHVDILTAGALTPHIPRCVGWLR